MKHKRDFKQGFTIVELLIVIVVIAILAAISVVAYTGVQNRANDSAVMRDVQGLAKSIQVWEVDNGDFAVLSSTTIGPGFTFKASKNSHADAYTMYICRENADPDHLVIGAKSKSGNIFGYSSKKGRIDYPQGGLSNSWGSGGTNCPRLFGRSMSTADFTYAYGKGSGSSWSSWIK